MHIICPPYPFISRYLSSKPGSDAVLCYRMSTSRMHEEKMVPEILQHRDSHGGDEHLEIR